jgi:hypothetical protein
VLAPLRGDQADASERHPAGRVVFSGLEVAETCFEVRARRTEVAPDEGGAAQVIAQVGVEGLAVGHLDLAPHGARLFEQRLRLCQPLLAGGVRGREGEGSLADTTRPGITPEAVSLLNRGNNVPCWC